MRWRNTLRRSSMFNAVKAIVRDMGGFWARWESTSDHSYVVTDEDVAVPEMNYNPTSPTCCLL